jgi:hypothetical protein
VFPLAPRSKVPAIPERLGGRGHLDATTNVDTVVSWWSKRPNYNIGARPDPDVFVLDVDPRSGGDVTFAELVAGRELPPTRTTVSGRGDGGIHLWWRHPGGDLESPGRGVDIKTHSGYVVMPPSIHPDTRKPYSTPDPHRTPLDPPVWLVDALRPPQASPAPPAAPRATERHDDADGPNVLEAVNILEWSAVWPPDWERIIPRRGVTPTVFGDEPAELWRRPGSTSIYSAKCGATGCHVFSTAVDGLPEGAYSKATVYAWRLGIGVDELARELWRQGREVRRAS